MQPNTTNTYQIMKTESEAALLCELFVDFDEGLQEWRYRHVKMVERTIGRKKGTGGSDGVAYQKTISNTIFPDLWQSEQNFKTITMSNIDQLAKYLQPFYSRFDVANRLLFTGHSHRAARYCQRRSTEYFDISARDVDNKWEISFEKTEILRNYLRGY